MKTTYLFAACMIAGIAYPKSASAILLDFDFDGFGAPIQPGQIIDDEYANLGVNITADNKTFRHPDIALAFDTGNPSGGDTDLATPGYHPSNTVAYGNCLILAENNIDANSDGLVDDPDDEANRPAGTTFFTLSTTFNMASFVLIDADDPGHSIEFLLNGSPVGLLPVPMMDDNEVMTVSFNGALFNEIRVNHGGSLGIAEINIVPEPGTLGLLAIAGLALVHQRRRRR